MATPFVAGNWKMHTTVEEAVALAQAVRGPLERLAGITRVVCPPFVSLAAVTHALEGSAIQVGAQNLHPEPKGAFTGEVSGAMLQGLCSHVIVGHSERRHHFGEDDATVNRKLLSAMAVGLTPILCVGERLEEREKGRAAEVVSRQLRAAVSGVATAEMARLAVAYEPVWAIGTGRAATGAMAQEMMGLLRTLLRERAGDEADEVPLLYGGSVTAENIGEFAREPDINGALVGGASLRAEEFVEIARQVREARP